MYRRERLVREVREYLKTVPGVEFIYPTIFSKVMDVLETHRVPPSVWVAIGEAIAEEGVYRALDSLTLSEEDIRPYAESDKLQSTTNVVKVPKKV